MNIFETMTALFSGERVSHTDTFILAGGANFVMDHIDDRLVLLHNGTEWVELSRSANS